MSPSDAGAREVVPGLWRLRLPLPWTEIGHTNAYAVESEDGIVLVDCGLGGHETQEQALAEALATAGFDVADVELLVLTHTHADHAGLAPWVIEKAKCEVWLHPDVGHFYDAVRDPDRIRAARARRAQAEGVPERLLSAHSTTAEEVEAIHGPVEPDRELEDGVWFESAHGPWIAIETPGHCPSHVCLYQEERGLLISGDLISVGFSAVFDYGYSADPVAEYLSTLERIEQLPKIELSLPGHGRPVVDVPEAIAVHRRGVADELAGVMKAVEAGPAGAYTIAERFLPDSMSGNARIWRLGDVSSYLRHLQQAGMVERIVVDGSFRYVATKAARCSQN